MMTSPVTVRQAEGGVLLEARLSGEAGDPEVVGWL
jgi:hypothetical protein